MAYLKHLSIFTLLCCSSGVAVCQQVDHPRNFCQHVKWSKDLKEKLCYELKFEDVKESSRKAFKEAYDDLNRAVFRRTGRWLTNSTNDSRNYYSGLERARQVVADKRWQWSKAQSVHERSAVVAASAIELGAIYQISYFDIATRYFLETRGVRTLEARLIAKFVTAGLMAAFDNWMVPYIESQLASFIPESDPTVARTRRLLMQQDDFRSNDIGEMVFGALDGLEVTQPVVFYEGWPRVQKTQTFVHGIFWNSQLNDYEYRAFTVTRPNFKAGIYAVQSCVKKDGAMMCSVYKGYYQI